MKIPKHIYVHKKLEKELKKKWLWHSFERTKTMILLWYVSGWVNFGLMKPKHRKVWYFRINKQFRVLWEFDNKGNLYVVTLDNHQNM